MGKPLIVRKNWKLKKRKIDISYNYSFSFVPCVIMLRRWSNRKDMHSISALTKLQAILIIDVIIVAVAAGGFFYIQSFPAPLLNPDQTQLTNLTLNPLQALTDQKVEVSFNVTNLASATGTYKADLLVDGVSRQTKSVRLNAGETKTVTFELSEVDEGVHIVKVGSQEESLTVLGKFSLSDLAINRTEAKVNEPIGISVRVSNRLEQVAEYSVALSINNNVVETKTGQLEASANTTLLFEVVEQTEGSYAFEIGDFNGTFRITSAAPPPKPAEFEFSNLIIDPQVAEPNVPVAISAKVTNVGESAGSVPVDLNVNGAVRETKSVQLAGGEAATVEFSFTGTAKGVYSVLVGNLSGELAIQDKSTIVLSDLFVKPYEVWVGDSVSVAAKATNPGVSASSLSVKLVVDGATSETKTVTLAAGASDTVQFSLTAASEGSHSVAVNTLTYGGYKVVKTGFHTLSVSSSPATGVEFTLNGAPHKTFYTELLPVGSYTVTVPLTDPEGRYTFQSWDTSSTNPTITVNLDKQITVTASFTGGSSCPALYFWNGTDNVYVGDVSNHGWLGYINYLNQDGSIVYYRNNPWDYIPLDGAQLQTTNGYYNLTLIQKWNEIFYLDQAFMLAVDHPADADVYSTMVEQYLDPAFMGQIYTVSKTPSVPVSAINERGENILPQISKMDGVFTKGTNGIQSPDWNNITWNRMTLDLGNLSGASQIKLVVRAIVDWGSGDDYVTWLDKFFAQPVPDGTQITPQPYMEVKDASGTWVSVPEGRQFSLPPDGVSRIYVVDLTGLFLANDYSLRISNFWNVTFDFVAVDTTPQGTINVQRIDPMAYHYQSFTPGTAAATGNFTKYGNVTQLLLTADDQFVIGRQGDAVSLQFDPSNLTSPAAGLVRDYFLFESCWFKDETGNWGFGFGFTVDPLPFESMSGFPYPPEESYPYDAVHNAYLEEWNNRVVDLPTP